MVGSHLRTLLHDASSDACRGTTLATGSDDDIDLQPYYRAEQIHNRALRQGLSLVHGTSHCSICIFVANAESCSVLVSGKNEPDTFKRNILETATKLTMFYLGSVSQQ